MRKPDANIEEPIRVEPANVEPTPETAEEPIRVEPEIPEGERGF